MDARVFLADKGRVKFDLPIDAVLPQVLACLTQSGRVCCKPRQGLEKPHAHPWQSYNQDSALVKF